MRGTEWTDFRVATLRRMVSEGAKRNEIAAVLKISGDAVGSKVARLYGTKTKNDRIRKGSAVGADGVVVPAKKKSAVRHKPRPGRDLPLLPKPLPGKQVVHAPLTATAVTLMDLPSFGACKFPVGAATGAKQLFCAAPIDSLYLRYCDHHSHIAYVPALKRAS